MSKEKTVQKRIKRLYTQLGKHALQPATRISRFAESNGIEKTILTRRGKIEKAILLDDKILLVLEKSKK